MAQDGVCWKGLLHPGRWQWWIVATCRVGGGHVKCVHREDHNVPEGKRADSLLVKSQHVWHRRNERSW